MPGSEATVTRRNYASEVVFSLLSTSHEGDARRPAVGRAGGEAIGEAREGGTGRSARLVLWSIDRPVTPSVPAVGGAGTLSGSGSWQR